MSEREPSYAIYATRSDGEVSWLTAHGAYTKVPSEAHVVSEDRIGEFVAFSVELSESFPSRNFSVKELPHTSV